VYRHCIYCSADLGANDSVEGFPIGRMLAFDGAKGRLWAVCRKCARWNLAPIEERWEAVEAAEKLFVDVRVRVQRENIGLARLRDGTRLVRVGQAVPGELAAWRYGDVLVRRRRQSLLATGVMLGGYGVAHLGWLAGMGGFALVASLWGIWNALDPGRHGRKVVYRLPAQRSPTGEEVVLRRWHAWSSVLGLGEGAGITLEVSGSAQTDPKNDGRGNPVYEGEPLVLADSEARTFMTRAMVYVNESGASRKRLTGAVELLGTAGSAEDFLVHAAGEGRTLAPREDMPGRALVPEGALALEMALHEESERRALHGELALLQSAWREAEEIAEIADRLALDPGPGR
jgi:hypothetical protein